MRKPYLWALMGLLIALPIVGSLVGTKVFQFKAMAIAGEQFAMPPEPVNVAEVREARWQSQVSAVGSVMAIRGTMVSTEAEGVVREINFTPGAQVKAGQVLARLDVDVEEAQLKAAEVDAEWAKVSFRRAQELSKTRNISEVDLDSAHTSVKQAEAQADYIRALIGKKMIVAPFSGTLGIQRVSVGQFLGKGSPVVSLQSLNPVYVEFSLPQQRVGELAQGLKVTVTADAFPGRNFEGVLTAINPDIDLATRSVRVQATLDNPDSSLRPGMFASVEVALAQTESVLLIPATAVQPGPHGDSVFVVEQDQASRDESSQPVVRQQIVRLGARQGDFVVVREGVSLGDKVVSTGVFKLRTGMQVVIDNSLAPTFSLAPRPNNT